MKYSTQVSRGYYMETTTADGRDLSKEEFRVIPEFPKYEITRDGDVRNIRTGKLILETEQRTGKFYYCLYKEDGRSTHKQWERLVWAAYPELKPPPKEKPVKERKAPPGPLTHCKKGGHELSGANLYVSPQGKRECRACTNARARKARKTASVEDSTKHVGYRIWRVANGYPLYEINKLGYVREISTGRMLEPVRNRQGRFYHLVKGGRVTAVKRTALLELTFPKRSEAA